MNTNTISVDDLPNSPARRKRKSRAMPAHLKEDVQQTSVVAWAEGMLSIGQRKELRMLFAIPNGGLRSKTEAKRLKAQGVKPGVPDLMLAVARCGAHGLFIEMKAGGNDVDGGQVDPDQEVWHADLVSQGYIVIVCWTGKAAIEEIERYLDGNTRSVTNVTEGELK